MFETFRSGGKGGQNVNQVESGVRAIYLPTGQAVVCTEERSQYANKQKALARLEQMLLEGGPAAEGGGEERRLAVPHPAGEGERQAGVPGDGVRVRRLTGN